ncbi:MAG: tyrosine-type recombinase/integrase [Vampirovibrionales bacterium]|nr:tyrosine-type recombinase/integrase [Vampirovibrionales bacterium]
MSREYKLAEVAQITGLHLEKLKIDSRRGHLPTEIRVEGKKAYKVITAETLANLLQQKDNDGYTELKAQWRQEMLSGTHSGTSTPVSESYLSDLEWGFKKFWAANGDSESIDAIDADGLRQAFTQFQFDEESRRDFYSSKMHIYKAISSFTQFLIRRGYKAPSILEEIKKVRPKARIKPQRHSLELVEVWEALNFNGRWNDGRTSNDIQVMDLLLFIYGFAGLRRMEAANIKITGINFSTNEILVPGKWGKDRLVPMPQELADKVKEWLENLRPESSLPYVIVNSQGNKLTEKSIACRFSRLSKALTLHKALAILRENATGLEPSEQHLDESVKLFFPSRSKEELPEEAVQLAKKLDCAVRPHDLRRAYAKMLADQGMPLPRIQYVLGHSDIETTMKYINIKQKEASDWIRDNFTITLPKPKPVQKPSTDLVEATEKSSVEPIKQDRKKKFRY